VSKRIAMADEAAENLFESCILDAVSAALNEDNTKNDKSYYIPLFNKFEDRRIYDVTNNINVLVPIKTYFIYLHLD
jgi:hypothetical protein